MALSEYEKQVLAQMEAELRQGDPDLASKMTSQPAQEPSQTRGRITPKRVAAGIALAVVGLLVLVGAVSIGYSVWSIIVGIIAFVLMVGGILFAFSPAKSSGITGRKSASAKSSAGGTAHSSWQDFMADQERRWDDRRQSD